jgi:Tol biopolymer transport system component
MLAMILPKKESYSQQFGRNKPNYEKFDFKIKKSPHFELYHYLKNDSLVETFSSASERWYLAHQKVFRDTFETANPIILYSNHADFWQTNAILGSVGIGTGGVTEALRNRVVQPVMELNSQTNHVLGHELVHAFQYKLLQNKEDSLSLDKIQNLPLWMVEGLAEYLSIGHIDPHTAMWMRDAIRQNKFPSLKDMTRNSEYFPYRYGQAFWSFMTGIFGDTIVYPLFRKTAKIGYDEAIKELTGMDEKAFSEAWKKNLTEYYGKFHALKADSLAGRLLIGKKVGRMNIAPAISPNGQYVAFLSEKNFFGIDLFLADAKTGRVLKTLSSTARESHIDDFSYIESTGAWSPYSDRFAFVSFSKGSSVLSIVDMNSKNKTTTINIPDVPYFSNPSWSPDGENIVVSGMVDGQGDLYLYNLKTKKVTNLTQDWYSDIQPQWSPDGQFILFVSDRPAAERVYKSKALQLCLFDFEEKDITVLDIFHTAENLNPVFSPDGQSIYFLSNRDGFRNLYQYQISDGKTYQLTNYLSGISGITAYSPALSISSGTGEISYTYYSDNTYSIYVAKPNDFVKREVKISDVNFSAGMLPPKDRADSTYNSIKEIEFTRPTGIARTDVPYKPKLGLEYIGDQVGIGVSTSTFGPRTGMAGGVDMLFGDMMGYHRVFTTLALNGEIYDFGGQAAYLNQKNRINWGFAISHTPYRSAAMGYKPDTVFTKTDTLLTTNMVLDVFRAFDSNVSGFVYLPFSTTRRLELGTGYSTYSFRLDRFHNHYFGGYRVREEREKLDAPERYRLGNTYAAYVYDNSYFGIASPMRGKRYRIEIEKTYDALDYSTLMIDYRQYAFLNPTALAFRFIHLERFGRDAESDRIYPLSFAYPTLTRGNSLDNIEGYATEAGQAYSINQIYGSRVLVGNVEWRIPFTGPERLSGIKSKLLFTEFALFADGGLAWTSHEKPKLKWESETPHDRIPFLSAGASMRINVFGMMVVEPYYALPWRGDQFAKGVFGLNFSPGW